MRSTSTSAPPEPTSPCWCGSGGTYENCHSSIDGATSEQKFEAAQLVYSRNWKPDSTYFYDQRLYHWMAELLSDIKPLRILDIGCGSGHGILALYETFGSDLNVISLDDNVSCLEIARDTLVGLGITVDVRKRLETRLTSQGFAQIQGRIELPLTARCSLIESDFCDDKNFLTALSEDKFDAITCWLIGTHMMRFAKATTKHIKSNGQYRLYVQNRVYELSDKLLRPGGVLQVVDRGQIPESAVLIEDVQQAHADQASVTSLEVRSVEYKVYDPLKNPFTRMRITPPELRRGTGPAVDLSRLAMTSVISIKP